MRVSCSNVCVSLSLSLAHSLSLYVGVSLCRSVLLSLSLSLSFSLCVRAYVCGCVCVRACAVAVFVLTYVHGCAHMRVCECVFVCVYVCLRQCVRVGAAIRQKDPWREPSIMCCSVLQFVAMRCTALWRVAVSCRLSRREPHMVPVPMYLFDMQKVYRKIKTQTHGYVTKYCGVLLCNAVYCN